ncbi:MAG: NADH-quinone oxidoreductase subunit A [Sulfobacillus benefaciens]|uniref:NADH-quinone oxidoreductase subunit n=1 Tax=Sulfobacillus benefaciens TaxID=453960 RepID=A0A2T2XFD5_9FIRM|nr:MAG: NADH-quinone oxidoreductase subunit A [Sulfobacillus benefaciens]
MRGGVEMTGYAALLVYLVVAFVVALGISFTSELLGPHAPGGLKSTTYESGIVPEAPVGYFSVRFYRVAMFFMIFDVGVMALYPWATSLKALHQAGFAKAIIFLMVVGMAFAYVWNKGGFQWD